MRPYHFYGLIELKHILHISLTNTYNHGYGLRVITMLELKIDIPTYEVVSFGIYEALLRISPLPPRCSLYRLSFSMSL